MNFHKILSALVLVVFSSIHSNTSNQEAEKIKIGFFFRSLNLRGVETSTYDYANYNESILNNESYLFLVNKSAQLKDNPDSPDSVRMKFRNRFKDRFYECETFEEIEQLIKEHNIKILYNQKSGEVDTHLSKNCKNAVHSVFDLDPHGDAYAAISKWLGEKDGEAKKVPYVPYICELPDTNEDLREKLNIPKDALVFGRHGGFSTFDIPFVMETVVFTALENPNVYFLFMNTMPFWHRAYGHQKNIIFLDSSIDPEYKTKFINTCDAMIHARQLGESFGLACAEFNIRNKPIITWQYGRDKAHIDMLGKSAFIYENPEDLKKIFNHFKNNIKDIRKTDWDTYSQKYNPESVMKIFDEVFIKPLL